MSFEDYWKGVDRELDAVAPAPDLQLMPLRSSDTFTTFALRLTSVGPYRIFGYYSIPKTEPPFPGLLLTPRYGSVNHIPDYYDRERYAVLQLMHRGQRLADQPFAAAYPGLLTHGIENPETYIYRGIVADCLRGADFLLSRPEVDATRIGIQGDDLAVIVLARRPAFTAAVISEMLLYRLLDSAAQSDAYPAEEINDFLRAQPGARTALARTLEYFDATRHAPAVRATTMLVGDEAWLQPLSDALGERAQRYTPTHRGAEDHDHLDAWLAGQLGTLPQSRFRDHAPPAPAT